MVAIIYDDLCVCHDFYTLKINLIDSFANCKDCTFLFDFGHMQSCIYDMIPMHKSVLNKVMIKKTYF